MKVRPSVKKICPKCKVIRRKGVLESDLRKPPAQATPGLTLQESERGQNCRY